MYGITTNLRGHELHLLDKSILEATNTFFELYPKFNEFIEASRKLNEKFDTEQFDSEVGFALMSHPFVDRIYRAQGEMALPAEIAGLLIEEIQEFHKLTLDYKVSELSQEIQGLFEAVKQASGELYYHSLYTAKDKTDLIIKLITSDFDFAINNDYSQSAYELFAEKVEKTIPLKSLENKRIMFNDSLIIIKDEDDELKVFKYSKDLTMKFLHEVGAGELFASESNLEKAIGYLNEYELSKRDYDEVFRETRDTNESIEVTDYNKEVDFVLDKLSDVIGDETKVKLEKLRSSEEKTKKENPALALAQEYVDDMKKELYEFIGEQVNPIGDKSHDEVIKEVIGLLYQSNVATNIVLSYYEEEFMRWAADSLDAIDVFELGSINK